MFKWLFLNFKIPRIASSFNQKSKPVNLNNAQNLPTTLICCYEPLKLS